MVRLEPLRGMGERGAKRKGFEGKGAVDPRSEEKGKGVDGSLNLKIAPKSPKILALISLFNFQGAFVGGRRLF